MYRNKSEIFISVCMLSNCRTELIFVPSVVRMNRTVFAKYVLKRNWHNAKFIFKHLETNSMKYKFFEGENVHF